MAAIVQMNKIPLVQWKGQTFDQIHSSIKKNEYTTSSNYHKFNANPLKIYRREIASQPIPTCNFRTSASVDVFNQPNGTINNSGATTKNGIAVTTENNIQRIVAKHLKTAV